jgi:predicted Rdx family selenoprotein
LEGSKSLWSEEQAASPIARCIHLDTTSEMGKPHWPIRSCHDASSQVGAFSLGMNVANSPTGSGGAFSILVNAEASFPKRRQSGLVHCALHVSLRCSTENETDVQAALHHRGKAMRTITLRQTTGRRFSASLRATNVDKTRMGGVLW